MKRTRMVGKGVPRVDGVAKATGAAQYAGDMTLPGMLMGRLLRSPHAHARIVHIDTSRARAVPGVKWIMTGQDTPKIKYGNWRIFPDTQDEYPLAVDKVRFIGDEVAAVAAVDVDAAEEAIRAIQVEYEVLEPVFDVVDATAPGAPVLHHAYPDNISVTRKIHYGDVDAAFEAADYVREDVFTVQPVSHAYLEPCACLARADAEGRITLWTSTQVPYIVQCLLASTLGIRENDVRVIKPAVGGGFGGKMELRPWEFCAAFMARKTGRPVRFTLSREEEFTAGRRRHGMQLTSRIGMKKDGTLLVKDLHIRLDGGAYNSMGPTATFLCGNFGAMLYRIPSYRFLGQHIYTNKPPAGAMRGFGAPQSLYVTETQMNMAAEDLGLDPLDLRLKNAMVSGDRIPEVATVSSCGFTAALKEVAKRSRWKARRRRMPKNRGLGIGCYSFISGGVFNWFKTTYPFSSAEVRAFSDGTVHLLTMAADIGQGSDTALKQILAEELGLRMQDIRLTTADTAVTPQADLGTWGSRVTLMAGNAIIDAARKIKHRVFGAVAAHFDLNVIYDLTCEDGRVFAVGKPERGLSFGRAVALVQRAARGEPLVARGYYTPHNKGLVTPAFSFGAQVIEVAVDPETAVVTPVKIWTAHDCGTMINPLAVAGQVEGSIQMGLGYALSEDLVTQDGQTINDSFLDYKMPTALDMPQRLDTVNVDTYEPEGPMGAKEVGEGLVSPTAPAIVEAVYQATGFRCRDLPVTPEKILTGLGRLPQSADPSSMTPRCVRNRVSRRGQPPTEKDAHDSHR